MTSDTTTTKTTKYDDTFWNSTDPDSITAGMFVPAGSVVLTGQLEGVYVECEYTDTADQTWHKYVAVSGLA